ncbi:hypothetical protein AFLA_004332 [Aspergillus flavus NRRL3357]|nr:hypothetical protein AFLA_004332 [Aspergillus flavus NRRL3357]
MTLAVLESPLPLHRNVRYILVRLPAPHLEHEVVCILPFQPATVIHNGRPCLCPQLPLPPVNLRELACEDTSGRTVVDCIDWLNLICAATFLARNLSWGYS